MAGATSPIALCEGATTLAISTKIRGPCLRRFGVGFQIKRYAKTLRGPFLEDGMIKKNYHIKTKTAERLLNEPPIRWGYCKVCRHRDVILPKEDICFDCAKLTLEQVRKKMGKEMDKGFL